MPSAEARRDRSAQAPDGVGVALRSTGSGLGCVPVARLITERRRARYCWRCQREWPSWYDACRRCTLSLVGSEREILLSRVAVNASVLRSRLALSPAWPETAPRIATTVVLRLTSEAPGQRVESTVLTAHLIELARALAAAGGWLDAAADGNLRAFFSGPRHALRAAAAAVRLLRVRQNLPGDAARALELRLGGNVGPLVPGRGGRVRGRSPEIAARLAELGRPGTLVVTEALARHLASDFDLVAIGLDEPLPNGTTPYLVLGPKIPDSHALHEQHDTPLAGRSSELAVLLDALDRLAKGHRGVVSIIAEPGIGKSRLLSAWLTTARNSGRLDDVICLQGLGTAYGCGPGTVLKGLLASVPDAVDGTLAELHAALDTWAEPAERLAKRLIDWLSRQRHVLVVIDDAHWADDVSLAVLHRLVRQPPPVPCLLVLSFRP